MEEFEKPDEADYRRSFAEEQAIMEVAVREASADRNASLEAGFFRSWCGTHEDDAVTIYRDGGASVFAEAFAASLRCAKRWIQDIITTHLAEHAAVIGVIDDVAAAGTADLVRWAAGDLGQLVPPAAQEHEDLQRVCAIANSWQDDHLRIPDEAMRELVLASKICRLEAIDPWTIVTNDMAVINDLCTQRLWYGRKVEIQVNYAINQDGRWPGHVHHGTAITFDGHPPSGPIGSQLCTMSMKCRLVIDGQTTYAVLTMSRPKEIESTILKEEELDLRLSPPRQRRARDRRGIMHVLVAVAQGGIWREAVANDLTTYRDLVSRRLWRGQLHLDPERSQWPNPESSPSFEREKMLGRLHRDNHRGGRRRLAVSVEHQVITARTYLSSVHATDGLNHDRYRANRIMRVLVPLLFGPSFQRLGIPLPR